MKLLSVVCITFVAINLYPTHRQPLNQKALAQATEPSAQSMDPDAQMLAQTGSIYQTTTITDITSQHPGGVWSISGHVSVTGFVMTFAHQVDGDLHVPFCDSPHFTVAPNGSSLPDKRHCVMAEIVPYLHCSVPTHLPSQQTIRGLMRFDGGPSAGWWEIHPVEFMTNGSCHVVGTSSVP